MRDVNKRRCYLGSYFLKVADKESTLDQRSLSSHTCRRYSPRRRCQETELLLRLLTENEGRRYQATATPRLSFVENDEGRQQTTLVALSLLASLLEFVRPRRAT
jgi:hypothetical protein